MTETSKLKLHKREANDYYSYEENAENLDKIDEAIPTIKTYYNENNEEKVDEVIKKETIVIPKPASDADLPEITAGQTLETYEV